MSGDQPANKKSKMTSSLAQLKEFTTVVADSGDFEGNFGVEFEPPAGFRTLWVPHSA
jgi:hypothetical protein